MKQLIAICVALLLYLGIAFANQDFNGSLPNDTRSVRIVNKHGAVGVSNTGANGLRTIGVDYYHHELHDCNAFNFHNSVTLNSGQSRGFLINTAAILNATEANGPSESFHLRFEARCSGEANFQLFKYPTFTAIGNIENFTQSNDLCSETARVVISNVLSVTAQGTFWDGKDFGSGVTIGGEGSSLHEHVLKPDAVYYGLLNSEAASNDCSLDFYGYEDDGDAH